MYVGDFVTFGDNTSGVVTKLGWIETTLRQGDNTVLNVPNAALASQKVSNVSRVRQCQVQQTIRLLYDDVDKIPQLIESIRNEIEEACPKLITDGTRPFRVHWTEFNEDHLEIMVNTHHNLAPMGDAYWKNRQAVLMAIARAVKKHDIELAQKGIVLVPGRDAEWRALPRHQ
jgi:small-conductance mechanosensitive channel